MNRANERVARPLVGRVAGRRICGITGRHKGGRYVLSALISALSLAVWAHEGHKALPTKGARVDGDTVFLSAEAHKAL